MPDCCMKIPVRHHCAETGCDVRQPPNQRLLGGCLLGGVVNRRSVKLTSHLSPVSASRKCCVVVTEVILPSKNNARKLERDPRQIHRTFVYVAFLFRNRLRNLIMK